MLSVLNPTRTPGQTQKFVILGLPRSGSTYLMTLLDSHPDIWCTGEQFNPFGVVGKRGKTDDTFETVVATRDADPTGFFQQLFDKAPKSASRVGFKFMLGHNVTAFQALEADTDITLIHVWRENRLAQVASTIKALETKRWAQEKRDAHIDYKITATPRQISWRWHENAMVDHLFQSWRANSGHRSVSIEYRSLFAPDFNAQICDFLGVEHRTKMRSKLVKQGTNRVVDRFKDPRAIAHYFRTIGYGHWLEEEL